MNRSTRLLYRWWRQVVQGQRGGHKVRRQVSHRRASVPASQDFTLEPLEPRLLLHAELSNPPPTSDSR